MSFFDKPENAGMALIVVALLNLIAAVIALYGGVSGDFDTGATCVAIGAIICAIIYFKFGQELRNNAPSKIDTLATYVKTVGLVTVIGGVFCLGYLANSGDNMGYVSTGVIGIILGLIVMWCASKINDGKVTSADKVLWIILTVIMVLEVIVTLVALVSSFGAGDALSILVTVAVNFCDLIIFLFMLLLLLDGEVKSKMGMN